MVRRVYHIVRYEIHLSVALLDNERGVTVSISFLKLFFYTLTIKVKLHKIVSPKAKISMSASTNLIRLLIK